MSRLWGPCHSEPEAVQDCQRSLAHLLLPVSSSVLFLPVTGQELSHFLENKNKLLLGDFPFQWVWGGERCAKEEPMSEVKVEQPQMGLVQVGWGDGRRPFQGVPAPSLYR